jgi:hypothetical protein
VEIVVEDHGSRPHKRSLADVNPQGGAHGVAAQAHPATQYNLRAWPQGAQHHRLGAAEGVAAEGAVEANGIGQGYSRPGMALEARAAIEDDSVTQLKSTEPRLCEPQRIHQSTPDGVDTPQHLPNQVLAFHAEG